MRTLLLLLTVAAVSVIAQTPDPGWPRRQPQRFVDLAYPTEALAARLTGAVVVQVTADETGRVAGAESLTGPSLLAVAAVANVRQWTLTPGVRTGVVVYRFEIADGLCNDDGRSLFRLDQPNLAIITACTGAGRPTSRSSTVAGVEFTSYGDRPSYHPIAQSARVMGVIVLDLSIARDGRVVESKPLSDVPLLTDAAVAHSRTWRATAGASDRRVLVAYEFALDSFVCPGQRQPSFREIAPGYVKVSGCAPLVDF
jgi:outer membrane biosynthesis protein TonB